MKLDWKKLVFPTLVCAAGLLLAHHEIILSGFARIPADPGDTRFNHYLMEHGMRWFLARPGHESLWDPHYFWPVKNVLAYSDVMLGAVPAYAPWRLIFAPDTAYQLWLLTVGALNFGAALWLFHRSLGLLRFPSMFGAAVFAFAAPRINQTMHVQLFAQFWSVVAVIALVEVFRPRGTVSARRAIFVFALCYVAQLYVGYYLGWFLGFGLLLAALAALVVHDWRRAMFAVIRAHPVALGIAAVVSVALLAPMAMHYFEAHKEVGVRPFEEAMSMIPAPITWLNIGKNSWLYAWMSSTHPFAGIPMEHEQRPGIGLVASALAFAGFVVGRKKPGALVFAVVGLVLLVCATHVAGFTLWKVVYEVVPGAKAVRAVARIGILLLLPAGLGIALFLDWLEARKFRFAFAAALAVGAVCLLEQGETTDTFDKYQIREDVGAIARVVSPDRCDAFVFSPLQGYGPYWKYQLDAMWAEMESGVPTMNGYSGNSPPNWPLGVTTIRGPDAEMRVAQAIGWWSQMRQVDTRRVCWARVGLNEGPYRSLFVSQAVPEKMVPGAKYPVTLTFKNDGKEAWRPDDNFHLGSESPQNNGIWGKNRLGLPNQVPPGGTVTFAFEATAPQRLGRFPFHWRVVKDGAQWIGQASELLEIDVSMPGPVSSAP